MRITREIDLGGGRKVIVKELTVGEVRAWLADLSASAGNTVDVVGEMLFDSFSLADLSLFVEGDLATDDLTQSQVRTLFAAAREINQDFFGLRAKLLTAGLNLPASPQPAPSEPSSSAPLS